MMPNAETIGSATDCTAESARLIASTPGSSVVVYDAGTSRIAGSR